MAVEIEKSAREILGKLPVDHPDREFIDGLFRATKGYNTRAGLNSEESCGKVNLKTERTRQAQRLIQLGFHRELGLSKKEYLASLSKFGPQPEAFKGRFDIPILVETRIPIERQCKLTGIKYLLEGVDFQDWPKDLQGYRTPDKPYFAWMQDGSKNLNETVQNVRETFKEDERGATIFDAIGLYLAHPEILKHHFINLPGTSVGSGYAPCLSLWYGGLWLHDCWVDGAGPSFGSASCGR